MSTVQFDVAEFRDELRTIQVVAGSLLDPVSEGPLRALEAAVERLSKAPAGSTATLTIPRLWPVKTISSLGRYDHAGGARFDSLFATISCVWEITPVGQPTKQLNGRRFAVTGTASTVIDLWIAEAEAKDGGWAGSGDCKVASWRLEVACDNSPGAFFHAQVPSSDADSEALFELWPRWLSVPRLPAVPYTPMLAIEFALSELFQDDWTRKVGGDGQSVASNTVGQWSKIQRRRLLSFFKWQADVVADAKAGSPLVAMKTASPSPSLLLP